MYNDAVSAPAPVARTTPSPPIDYSPPPPRISSDPPYYPRDWQQLRRNIDWPRYWGDAPEDQPTRLTHSSARLPYWLADQQEDDIVEFRRESGPWTSGPLHDRHTPQTTWPETEEGNAARHAFRRMLIRKRLGELRTYCPELEEMDARAVAQFEINQFFPLRPQDDDWRPPRVERNSPVSDEGPVPPRPTRDPLFET
ncbi:hypothetical protein B0H11DRAFT_1899424 [Mycena galericulata]|nr:hypothetical protein B0H11DRAFT_1899424 [Mycena galericulata]